MDACIRPCLPISSACCWHCLAGVVDVVFVPREPCLFAVVIAHIRYGVANKGISKKEKKGKERTHQSLDACICARLPVSSSSSACGIGCSPLSTSSARCWHWLAGVVNVVCVLRWPCLFIWRRRQRYHKKRRKAHQHLDA